MFLSISGVYERRDWMCSHVVMESCCATMQIHCRRKISHAWAKLSTDATCWYAPNDKWFLPSLRNGLWCDDDSKFTYWMIMSSASNLIPTYFLNHHLSTDFTVLCPDHCLPFCLFVPAQHSPSKVCYEFQINYSSEFPLMMKANIVFLMNCY